MQTKSCAPSWRATTARFWSNCVYTAQCLTGKQYSREHIVPLCFCRGEPEATREFHNVWPALAELNRARANFRFVDHSALERRGMSESEWYVDARTRVFVPPRRAQGIIARTVIYMSERYSSIDVCEVIDYEALVAWQWHEVSDYEVEHRVLAAAAMSIVAAAASK